MRLETLFDSRRSSIRIYAYSATLLGGDLWEAATPIVNWIEEKLRETPTGSMVVGIVGPQTVSYLTAVLGAWRSGCAYLPLNPAQPEKSAEVLRHVQPVAVIVADGERMPHFLATFTGAVCCAA